MLNPEGLENLSPDKDEESDPITAAVESDTIEIKNEDEDGDGEPKDLSDVFKEAA